MNLNQMAAEVHAANAKWWIDLETGERLDRNRGEMLMLMVSEVSEAMEGERKGLMDDKLPHRRMAEVEMADVMIRALDYAGGWGYALHDHVDLLLMHEDHRFWNAVRPTSNRAEALLEIVKLILEIAGCEERGVDPAVTGDWLSSLIAACWVYCSIFGYSLMGAYRDKMAFNAVREDHPAEARKLAGGKKW